MFRKISVAVISAAALAAALAPTSASAWGRGFHDGGFHREWRGGFEHRGFGFGYGYEPGWCYFHPYRCERPL
jgi:hypothetical protein